MSGVVQTFGMGSDALVAGRDVATANCTMVKWACATTHSKSPSDAAGTVSEASMIVDKGCATRHNQFARTVKFLASVRAQSDPNPASQLSPSM